MSNDAGISLNDTFDDLAVEIADEMPEVTNKSLNLEKSPEHVTQQAEESPSRINNDDSQSNGNNNDDNQPVDRDGRFFNNDIHMADNEGQPVINKDGTIRMKPGSGSPRNNNEPQPSDNVAESDSTLNVDNDIKMRSDPEFAAETQKAVVSDAQTLEAAIATTSLLLGVGQMIGGDEWSPNKQTVEIGGTAHVVDEEQNLQQTFYRYYKATGSVNPPPWLDLTIGLSAFCLPRFRKPRTKSWFSKKWDWVKLQYQKRKVKKNGAQSDNRGDGGGENNVGETIGEGVSEEPNEDNLS